MQQNNNLTDYYLKESVFSPGECEALKHAVSEEKKALVSEEGIEAPHFRQTQISLLPPKEKEWVFERIEPILTLYNTFYKFELNFIAPPQILRYPRHGHYAWHLDVGPGPFSTRKLSMVVQLSEPSSYEGGELLLMTGRLEPVELKPQQGELLIFPSYLLHKVSPVLKGERTSMVIWAHGTPFR